MYGRRRYVRRIPRRVFKHLEQNIIPFSGSTTYDFGAAVNALVRYQHDILIWSYGVPALLKNIKIDWGTDSTVYWAIIVFQQNYGTLNPLMPVTYAPQLYEPQENVIASGILDNNDGVRREFIRCSRKMSPGNTLRLLLGGASTGLTANGVVKFYNNY